MSNEQSEILGPLDIKEIQELIPHRYPFLLVDRVLEIDFEKKRIVGQKNVSMNDWFFQGHFPKEPIMPGVLQIEALAQLAAILIAKSGNTQLNVLAGIREAKFRRAVRPGDVLMLEIDVIHLSKLGGKVSGRALVDGKVTAQAEIVSSFLTV